MPLGAEAIAEMNRRIEALPRVADPHVMLVHPELFRLLRVDALAAGVYMADEPFAYLDHVKRTSPRPVLRYARRPS